MFVPITFIAVIEAGWKSLAGQLLASGVLLVSGYQDMGLRARIGATFWFFMALAFATSALATAFAARLWGGVALCAAALSLETWLILRWRRRRTSV